MYSRDQSSRHHSALKPYQQGCPLVQTSADGHLESTDGQLVFVGMVQTCALCGKLLVRLQTTDLVLNWCRVAVPFRALTYCENRKTYKGL